MITIAVAVAVTAIAITAGACTGGAAARGAEFGDIQGKEWKLAGIRTAAGDSAFNRGTLEKEGFGGAYTLRFDGERLSGMAAPNRYTGPYALGEGQTLEIKRIASTLMASLTEPSALKEAEYFAYLEKAGRWALVEGRLELHTESPGGESAVLVFTNE
jgi:heat shock protein HslJ